VSVAELPLEEVTGPSALGGGWRRFVRLTWLVATTDFKLTYFGSVLGYFWSLLQPLLFFGVLYLMFDIVLQLGKETPNFPVILLMNIVLFTFFQTATAASIPSVVVREGLVRKMHFPRLVIPVATAVTSSFNLCLNLIVVLGFMIVYGVEPRLTWFLLLPLLGLLFAFSAGIAMLLSSLYVRYRDVAQIWGVIIQALFYASPVFILIENIEKRAPSVTRYYLFNPIAAILQQARHWMVGGTPGISTFMGGAVWVLVPLAILVGTCVLGFWVFSREAPGIAEEL
jgi:ABC-2 type transport system permease protein